MCGQSKLVVITRDIIIYIHFVLRINENIFIIILLFSYVETSSLLASLLSYSFACRRRFHSVTFLSLLYGRRLRVLQTALDVLRPVANVLVGVEDKIHGTGHVMLAFSLAHVVHRAIVLIRVIRYVIVLLVAQHLIRCEKKATLKGSISRIYLHFLA